MGVSFYDLDPVRRAAFVALALGALMIVSFLGSSAVSAGIQATEPGALERSPFAELIGDPKSRFLGQVILGLAVLISGAGLWFYKPWSVYSLASLAAVGCGVMALAAVHWWAGFPSEDYGSIGAFFRVAGVGMGVFWVVVMTRWAVFLISPDFRSLVKGKPIG